MQEPIRQISGLKMTIIFSTHTKLLLILFNIQLHIGLKAHLLSSLVQCIFRAIVEPAKSLQTSTNS